MNIEQNSMKFQIELQEWHDFRIRIPHGMVEPFNSLFLDLPFQGSLLVTTRSPKL